MLDSLLENKKGIGYRYIENCEGYIDYCIVALLFIFNHNYKNSFKNILKSNPLLDCTIIDLVQGIIYFLWSMPSENSPIK